MQIQRLQLLAPRGSRQRWIAARALVCAGALLFAVASWLPWWQVTVTFPGDGHQTFTMGISATTFPFLLFVRLTPIRSIDPETLATSLSLLWYGVQVGGVLVALTLWQRVSARLAVVVKRVFRVWLLFSAVPVLLSVWLTFRNDSRIWPNDVVRIVRSEIGSGLWLALAALALVWIGALLMAGEPRMPERAALLTWRRSRKQYLGLVSMLGCAALWSLGYNALPWATVNCPAPRLSLFHFVDGACAGLDSGDTLMAGVASHLPATLSFDTINALVLVDMLLVGSALLLIAGAARRTYTRAFCGWVLAWLLAATSIALLSYSGVPVVIAHPPILSSAAIGAWHADLGVFVTFAGLLCGWASLIPLEAAGIAHAPPADSGSNAKPATAHAVAP